MKKTWLSGFIAAAVMTINLSANVSAAERYEVIESIDVSVSAEQAWNAVKDFGGLHNWHPAVTKTEIVEGELPLRGAVRILTIGDGDGAGTVKESLTAYSDEEMKLSYVINSTDVIPVKDYASTINVIAINDSLSLIIWSGNFLSNPPPDKPDSFSQETMISIYRAGLENVKQMLEQ